MKAGLCAGPADEERRPAVRLKSDSVLSVCVCVCVDAQHWKHPEPLEEQEDLGEGNKDREPRSHGAIDLKDRSQ